MTPDERALSASIRQTLSHAYGAVSDLESLSQGNTLDNVDEGPHAEALDALATTLAHYVKKLFRDVKLLAERLNAPMTAAEVAKLEPPTNKAADTEVSGDGFYSRHILNASNYFESLEALTDGKDVTGLHIFETTLGNTGKIIFAFNLNPRNEAGVQKAMAVALNFSFHDAMAEVKISNIIKSYRADFGVRSLKAVAEYKFIDKKEEMKRALDTTFTDMKGYEGTFEWRHFYAVYYMTGPFFTQGEVDAVYKMVKADMSWIPIVVNGQGDRRQ